MRNSIEQRLSRSPGGCQVEAQSRAGTTALGRARVTRRDEAARSPKSFRFLDTSIRKSCLLVESVLTLSAENRNVRRRRRGHFWVARGSKRNRPGHAGLLQFSSIQRRKSDDYGRTPSAMVTLRTRAVCKPFLTAGLLPIRSIASFSDFTANTSRLRVACDISSREQKYFSDPAL